MEAMGNFRPINHDTGLMLLGLLVYGYATKAFSGRAIERPTHDSVAFR